MIPDFWIAIELETSSSEFKSNIFARSMTIELALYPAAQVGKHYYSFYLIAATNAQINASTWWPFPPEFWFHHSSVDQKTNLQSQILDSCSEQWLGNFFLLKNCSLPPVWKYFHFLSLSELCFMSECVWGSMGKWVWHVWESVRVRKRE